MREDVIVSNELALRPAAVVVPAEATLDELAEIANREHESVGDALLSALTHAIKCGEALLEARELVGPGGWEDWLSENVGFSSPHASRYLRLATYKSALPDDVLRPWRDARGRLRQPSINRALPYVKGLPHVFPPISSQALPPEVKREAKRLRQGGLAYEEIGDLLGISRKTAARFCDPAMDKRQRVSARKRKLRSAAAQRALREKEQRDDRDRAAKASGDSRGKTYNLILAAAQEAHRALVVAADPETRAALNTVLAALYRAEDGICRALKVP